jgi:hypothetical protein
MAPVNHGATQNDLVAYAAGLFDGEGCVVYKQYKIKKGCWKWHINLEIAMTEIEPLHWFYNIVKVGTINYKKKRFLYVFVLNGISCRLNISFSLNHCYIY